MYNGRIKESITILLEGVTAKKKGKEKGCGVLEEGGYGRGGKWCVMRLHEKMTFFFLADEKMIFLIICGHNNIIEHICVNLSVY